MFNIVKRRDFMLGQPAQTRQEAEKLLAGKYGQDHIVVEANRATRASGKAGDRLVGQKRAIAASKTAWQAGSKINSRNE
jgi:hypothetical protein